MSPKNAFAGADLSLSIEALKRKVLDAAVRGELTEQLAEDGTAKDLLMQISDEKKRLIAEGKIKREKALPAISDEEIPFEIPENWEWVRLGNISNFGTNISVEPNEIGNDEWILELEDIEKETGNVLTRKKKAECNPQSTKHKFRKGNVLYSKMRPYLNKVLVADDDGYCTSEIHVLDFGKYILPTYARMYLQSPDFLSYANDHSYGDKPRLKTIDGRLALFSLPPLAEQHRIVEKIDEAFHQLDELKKLQDAYSSNLDALRKKVIEEGIKGNLTERQREDGTAAELLKEIEAEKQELIKAGKIKKEKPLPEITDEEMPFEIPENWEWVRLGDVCSTIHYGYTASASEFGNAHLLRITDIQDNSVCWNQIPYCTIDTDTAKKYVLNDNDILFARTGGTVGKSYIVSGMPNDEIYVFASYLIRAIPTPRVNAKYLKKFMESSLYWCQIAENAIGSGQPNVNGESLKRIILPLPPLAEQHRIVKKIEEVLETINLNEI